MNVPPFAFVILELQKKTNMALPAVYLDHNATTQPYPEVVDLMSEHLLQAYGNPGSRHAAGRVARKVLEESRESMAAILDCDPREIIFTSGGTEASNMALLGLARDPGIIAMTAGEHPATTETRDFLARQGFESCILNVGESGLLDSNQYATLPWSQMKIVTVILAHNETGVIQNLQPLAEMCAERGVPLHVDAVQAVGKIPISFRNSGATTLALGAHKFHGPRGIGALLVREGVELKPMHFGGHQESGRRPGTEPVALIAGMARALEIWHANQAEVAKRLSTLRDKLQQGLLELCDPAVVNGSLEHRLPNTLNIAFPGLDGEALLVAFDLEGICCSLGSTCASGSAEPAPALVAMNCPENVYKSSVRFSLGLENSPEEIDEAITRIARVVNRLRATIKPGE